MSEPVSLPGNEPWLRRLWAEIPQVECKGLCQESCGPFPIGAAENAAVARASGRWWSADEFDKALGNVLGGGDAGECPNLVAGRCTVYAARPTLCRLWGAVPEMACPHGCATTMTSQAGRVVMHALIDNERA